MQLNEMYSKWTTPFLRQCFVTSGVFLNMVNCGLVLSFSAWMMSSSGMSDSVIRVEDLSRYSISFLPVIAVITGIFIMPPIMGYFGRKVANLINLCTLMVAWSCLILSHNIFIFIIGRLVTVVAIGMILTLAPVFIGEYTSPKNRGVFLMTITISIALGVLFTHLTGYYVNWQILSIVSIGIAVLNLTIIILSPESPTFLAGKGKYDESRKVFRYLRGENEDEELEKIITARENNYAKLKTLQHHVSKQEHFVVTIRKREFFKPILILIHLFAMTEWSGVNISIFNLVFLIRNFGGSTINYRFMVIELDVTMFTASILGLIVIKWVKRRKILFVVGSLNIAVNLAIAVFSFMEEYYNIRYIRPPIGLILIHIQMFVGTIGAMQLSFVLAGELYPMEHRCLCAGIGAIFLSLSSFANYTAVVFMLNTISVYGLYFISTVIMAYCMLFVGFTLPETKDKTLQDIENEFKDKKIHNYKIDNILEVNKRNKLCLED